MPLSAPHKLTALHQVDEFDSGDISLDDWLERRAMANEGFGASRTYVVADEMKVVGYYALAVGSVMHPMAPRSLKRNMPEPLPIMVLGRLAIDQRYQQQGLGKGLLKDAILRTIQVADIAGVCCLLVHAISESAKEFYLHHGFVTSPLESRTLLLTLKNAKRTLASVNT